jgi:hypothetical protein
MKKGNTAAHYYSVNICLVSFLHFKWPIPMQNQLISLGANSVGLIGRPYRFCRPNSCWWQGAARVWLILHLRMVTGQNLPALCLCVTFSNWKKIHLLYASLCAQSINFPSTCHRCTLLLHSTQSQKTTSLVHTWCSVMSDVRIRVVLYLGNQSRPFDGRLHIPPVAVCQSVPGGCKRRALPRVRIFRTSH